MIKIKKHLKDNGGRIYWFAIICTLLFIMLISATLSIIKIGAEAKTIQNEVETQADIVLSAAKADYYDAFVNATADREVAGAYGAEHYITELAVRLSAQKSGHTVTKKEKDKTVYTLTNVKFEVSGGVIMLTFDLSVPISFSGKQITTANKNYTLKKSFNYKDY